MRKIKHKVLKKQNNSLHCLVCGLENDLGLKASFYELDNDELVAYFTTQKEHQSYPGRLHSGISSAIINEAMARAIMISEPHCWAVTMEFKTRYLKPVPLDNNLKVVARVTQNFPKTFTAESELILPNGQIAIMGSGKYAKMKLPEITTAEFFEFGWQFDKEKPLPEEIEI
ncbi:MAG: PaaI family thioesterase [Bacillota bacterium]